MILLAQEIVNLPFLIINPYQIHLQLHHFQFIEPHHQSDHTQIEKLLVYFLEKKDDF